MANTYHKLYIHLVFASKFRNASIGTTWRNRLYSYMQGIIKKQGCTLLIANGTDDHVHLLIALLPRQSISNLVQLIKGKSSKWINENELAESKFAWQIGFSAFSVKAENCEDLILYIRNQEEHHKKVSFREELAHQLRSANIDFDEKYIFKDPK